MSRNVRTLEPGPSPSRGPEPRRGRWVPTAAAAAGVAAFLWLAGVLSPGDDVQVEATAPATAAPQPPPTLAPVKLVVTDTPVPPTLLELVPGLARGITVVYLDQRGSAIGSAVWSRHLADPTPAGLSGTHGWDVAAAYDRGGLDLVVHDNGALWAGEPPMATPLAVGVTGWAWHDVEPRLLAWTARPPGGEGTRLYTADVSGGQPSHLTDLGPVPAGARLAGWGPWGFALNIAPPPDMFLVAPTAGGGSDTVGVLMTQVLDADAAPIATIAAETLATGPDGMLVLRSTVPALATALEMVDAAELDLPEEPAADLAELTGDDMAADPSVVVVLAPDLSHPVYTFTDSPPGTDYRFSPDGRTLVAAKGDRERVTITGLDRLTDPRRYPVTALSAETILGFDGTGRWLLLSADDGGTIVFRDLHEGRTHRVPFPLGPVLAASP